VDLPSRACGLVLGYQPGGYLPLTIGCCAGETFSIRTPKTRADVRAAAQGVYPLAPLGPPDRNAPSGAGGGTPSASSGSARGGAPLIGPITFGNGGDSPGPGASSYAGETPATGVVPPLGDFVLPGLLVGDPGAHDPDHPREPGGCRRSVRAGNQALAENDLCCRTGHRPRPIRGRPRTRRRTDPPAEPVRRTGEAGRGAEP
jgi:hypothetical protein